MFTCKRHALSFLWGLYFYECRYLTMPIEKGGLSLPLPQRKPHALGATRCRQIAHYAREVYRPFVHNIHAVNLKAAYHSACNLARYLQLSSLRDGINRILGLKFLLSEGRYKKFLHYKKHFCTEKPQIHNSGSAFKSLRDSNSSPLIKYTLESFYLMYDQISLKFLLKIKGFSF